MAVKLGISPAKQEEVVKVLLNLYDLFLTKDASMVEINPFAEVPTPPSCGTVVLSLILIILKLFGKIQGTVKYFQC